MSALARSFFALTLAVLPFTAQQTTATLVGSITDASGALMPNVANLATNAQRDTKSDDTGAYSLPFLTAGDYSVTVTLAGFQMNRVERITLQVQQTARLDS
jgi:hypothetical protein